ncbi:MAG: hypothetical protein AAB074_17040 [Planctomycetota bacterium]
MDKWKIDVRLAVIPAVFGIGCLVGSLWPRSEARAEGGADSGKYLLFNGTYLGSEEKTVDPEAASVKLKQYTSLFRLNTETGETMEYSDGLRFTDGSYIPTHWSGPVEDELRLVRPPK